MGGSVAHTARTKADEAELSPDSQKLQFSDSSFWFALPHPVLGRGKGRALSAPSLVKGVLYL